jgi:hypothetical protein
MVSRRISVVMAVLLAASTALADDDAAGATTAFKEGTAFVVQAKWAEALAAFERASALKRHPVTTYNIGACERALGRYTRARTALKAALAENAPGSELPPHLVESANSYLAEIDKLLIKINVELIPGNASVLVDGRPLQAEPAPGKPVLVAGLRAPGKGESPVAPTFTVLADPGPHVILLARAGFNDAVVNRTFAPGSTTSLRLELDRLPATLQIHADKIGALVTVDGKDLGPAPVDVLRPSGKHNVVVAKTGFVTYSTDVSANAGQVIRVQAVLPEDKPAITSRWWFWTAAAVVVTGVAATTWYVTRPEPTRPEVDGGTLGWKVDTK